MAEHHNHPSNYLLISLLAVIAILFGVTAYMSLHEDDALTAWASLKKQMGPYMDECEADGGTVTVEREKGSDDRVFTCHYADGSTEVLTFSKR